MKDRISEPIFEIYRRAVALIVPQATPQIEIEMHALALIGVSIIFHFNQCKATGLLNLTMDDSKVSMLKVVAFKQLGYALTGLSHVQPTA